MRSRVIDLIDLVAKHMSGELRCPASAFFLFCLPKCQYCFTNSYLCFKVHLLLNSNSQLSFTYVYLDFFQCAGQGLA